MTLAAAGSLAIFTALIASASLQLLAISGHFPLHERGSGTKTAPAVFLLWLSLAVTLAALLVGLWAAWRHLPWQDLVIAGGFAVLLAPLALQQFSDRFVDGDAALVTFAAATALSALLLVGLTL